MSNINTKASALAVVVETVEASVKVESAGAEFLAISEDVSLSPSFEQLEDASLKNSLGSAKTIVGSEAPSGSFSLYFKHSNTEGVAPEAGPLYKGIFGVETIDASEETTTGSSTTSLIKLASGGADHPRGTCVLVKDSTNGYSIRPVHSVSTDDLTLGFDIGTAPLTGIDVGKNVAYSPSSDTSVFDTFTVHHFIGNDGALETMAGSRPVSLDITCDAGQLITSSWNMEGVGFYFDPLTVTASNQFVDFDDGAVQLATVPVGTYKTPHDLASAIQTACDAQSSDNISVNYDDATGSFTIASDGSSLSILWKTGVSGADNTDTHIGTLIGFSDLADDTGVLTYTADSALDWTSAVTPSFDSSDPIVAKGMQCFVGDSDNNTCFDPSSISISMAVPKTDVMSVCAESGKSGSLPASREVTINCSALLQKNDAKYFERMRNNTETRFFLCGGSKTGGNWQAGKCFGIYAPTCTVSEVSVSPQDSLAQVDFTLTTFVDADGNGEFYINFI